MRQFIITSIACLLGTGTTLAAPNVPGEVQKQPIALVGGVIHPASGPAIEGGVLLMDGGKIVAVGKADDKDMAIPKDARQIDVAGKHVYPGLIESHSALGLIEIDAVRATKDTSETGRINPNARAQLAFNPDSELIPVARAGGVLAAVSAPGGGLMTGQPALMYLDGWTWEDMTVRAPLGIYVRWPRMSPITAWWMDEDDDQQRGDRDKALTELREALDAARAYQKSRSAGNGQPADVRWEALLSVLEGKQPLIVAADDIKQIEAAVAFADREKLKLIIHGGYDAPHCAELLKKHDVPVLVGGVHRLPRRRHEPYDEPFTVAARLQKAGVRFAIAGSSRFGASNVRNLPDHAATAAAYGLPADESLRAITLYPAQILGVADRLGSLEKGKDATVLVADGDILEVATRVEQAWICGREVDLSSRHTRLWEKYRERQRRISAASARKADEADAVGATAESSE